MSADDFHQTDLTLTTLTGPEVDGGHVRSANVTLDPLSPLAVKQRHRSWPVEALYVLACSGFSVDSHCTLMRPR